MNHWLNRTTIRFAILTFGVLCGSTAVLMIKAGSEHPMLVAAYRLFVAALVLTPFFLRELPTYPGRYGLKQLGWVALPAVMLAVHFITWIIGARMTQVANASMIVNLTPVAMPFFLMLFYREKIGRQEVIGTLFTLSGLVALTGSNISLSQDTLLGDVICIVSMLTFAAYMALGRKNGGRLGLWLYMVPLYWMAGVLCLLCALFFVNPIKPYDLRNVLLILGLGIIPTIFGHTILNYSLKFFRGQVVSVANLGQPFFAGIAAYFLFKEEPRPVFFVAAALMMTGILIVLQANWKKREVQKV
ncbi:MAG: DMT family transporter [Anaerolineaceae bacterium]|nr:DMT family transporter [Anaerolineaceae bacterium]